MSADGYGPSAGPMAGSIEDLGQRLIVEANASRCVAYRRNGSGNLVWETDVEFDGPYTAEPPASDAAGVPGVMITRPVRDAFGQIIGVLQTRDD